MRRRHRQFAACVVAVSLLPGLSRAGQLPSDEQTLLLLRFDNSLTGVGGEVPLWASGVLYLTGVDSQAAFFGDPNEVTYATAGNLDGTRGTLEFWLQPQWNGNDSQNHWILQAGGAGGFLVGKDGGNYWRIILNRFGAGGNPEIGAGHSVANEWLAGEWHHAAFSWSSEAIKVYVDGQLRASHTGSLTLPTIADPSFHLGSDNGTASALALIDELRISSEVRSEEEILASYLAGPTVSSLELQPPTVEMLETWWITPEVAATTNVGVIDVPPAALMWSSTDEAVASVDAHGRIVAHSNGTATLTGSLGGASDTVDVTVTEPVLPPVDRPVDPYLATPDPGALWKIPVVVLRYLPTLDGINVDARETGWTSSLASLEERIDRLTVETKFMLEEGSRFRGYAAPLARSSLGYRVVKVTTVFEKFQRGREASADPLLYFPDYEQVLTRANAGHWVNVEGVKEFWIWGYHHGDIVPVESNMSSPLTGDISNSYGWNDDLPIFDSTYTVYNYNYTRTSNESVHNHGHQLEAILSYACALQDGTTDLFWHHFVGQDVDDQWITGRCGWTHMPPNTTDHYDYWNMALVESDCPDWTPAGTGTTHLVNADTWGALVYPWPDGPPPDDLTQHQFYIWWMQNMPGRGNAIPHESGVMTNWWAFTGDWDGAISHAVGLHGADDCGGAPELVLSDRLFDAPETVEACRVLTTAGQVSVTSTEEVRFRAGEEIRLGAGFSVAGGAALALEIAPVLFPF